MAWTINITIKETLVKLQTKRKTVPKRFSCILNKLFAVVPSAMEAKKRNCMRLQLKCKTSRSLTGKYKSLFSEEMCLRTCDVAILREYHENDFILTALGNYKITNPDLYPL